jgi:hypothetical protein
MALPVAEQAQIREDALATLLETAEIRRKTGTAWGTVPNLGAVPARLALIGHQVAERMDAAAAATGANALVNLPWGTDVRIGDQVVIGARRLTVSFIDPDPIVWLRVLGKLDPD